MAVRLTKGGRVDLTKGTGLKEAMIGLGWDTNKYDGAADFDLDASAFLLGANGKVRKDEDFIFYGNLQSLDGGVTHTGDSLSGGSGGDDETLPAAALAVVAAVGAVLLAVGRSRRREGSSGEGRKK